MIKAFLSHSTSDKERYVRIVASQLGEDNCVYDEYTFDFGLQSIEEIIRGLEVCQLFVVFLSSEAFGSKWVQKEILLAHEKLTARELDRIYPIIIDPSVTYLDTRIPQWMKDEYNLKYVSRPTVAARRIRQRLREISWLHNPRLKEIDKIFVGRNDLVKTIEERVDDFDRELPTCFIATGLPRIGRSALLRHALIKSNVIEQSYELPSIVLRREDSLEDLILKLFDLGFSQLPYPTALMSLDIGQRLNIAGTIVKDIQNAKEIILIRDEGCIVDGSRQIRPWFDEILKRTMSAQRLTFLISARYRPAPETSRLRPYIFAVGLPELAFTERCGLFKRLLEFEKIGLTREAFRFFTGLFQGFPEQIRFASDMIRDLGISDAQKESYQITEFSSDRAATILAKYADRRKVIDFLYLLSQFEFISLDFLFSLVDESDYANLLNELITASICDYVGIEKEFIRVNDAIRDFVHRNRLALPAEFLQKLNAHLDEFLEAPNEEERDISDITFSIKEAIKAGRSVRQQYLIPSHFLRSMRELYQERGNLDRVIELADRLLEKEHFLDPAVAHDFRYYLCLSLARKRDSRLVKEIQKIPGPEHDFILGFYYRLVGRPNDAIQRLKKCLFDPIVSTVAKRELVQVLLSIEDFESASSLAQSNYEENRSNPYHIQAYFNSIVNSQEAIQNKDLLVSLIQELESIASDVSTEMAHIAKAEFAAKCEYDYIEALDIINDAVEQYPDSPYPLLTKTYLTARHRDLENLKASYDRLEQIGRKRNISDSLIRLKSYIIVLEGNLDKALTYADSNLRKCPEYSRLSFLDRLREIANNVCSST